MYLRNAESLPSLPWNVQPACGGPSARHRTSILQGSPRNVPPDHHGTSPLLAEGLLTSRDKQGRRSSGSRLDVPRPAGYTSCGDQGRRPAASRVDVPRPAGYTSRGDQGHFAASRLTLIATGHVPCWPRDVYPASRGTSTLIATGRVPC